MGLDAGRAERKCPLVSIGVPAYNGARYLTQALESALSQQYSPLEIIVSDDCSTDETEAICRRFVASDPRVRYLRGRKNVGAAANFRRVLHQARGSYFTWLAQDDVLVSQHYIGTLVEYLECHPDVVCCATALTILDLESPGSRASRAIPELDASQLWPEARRELFRWPQGYVLASLYGLFRRAELSRAPIVTRHLKGRPIAAFWEIPVLAAVALSGRIVALPECLRGYRVSGSSDGDRIHQGTSAFDLFVLGMETKLALLRLAVGARVPIGERLDLVRITFGNMGRANLRRPWDYQVVIRQRESEVAVLHKAAIERRQLIGLLRTEIERRMQIVGALGHGYASTPSPPAADRALPRLRSQQYRQRLHSSMIAFFRPPPTGEIALYRDLGADIAALRPYCESQVHEIAELTSRAEALMAIIDAAQPKPNSPEA